MQTCIFHLQNISALHVGTGQGVGVIDMPIARSKATNLPLVPGSALKGVLRDEFSHQLHLEDSDIKALFGPDNQLDTSHAGAIAFGDANLLLLPVRSFAGTVAYATCPFILRQYKRDLNLQLNVPNLGSDMAGVVQDSVLFVNSEKNEVALEDLDIQVGANSLIKDWADDIATYLYPEGIGIIQAEQWREEIAKRFIVLPDDVFSFLADTATEVRTRIRIDRDTRIVKEGALWTEENLPAETVMWGLLGVSDARDKTKRKAQELMGLVLKNSQSKELSIQIGGKHAVGRGLCRLLINSL